MPQSGEVTASPLVVSVTVTRDDWGPSVAYVLLTTWLLPVRPSLPVHKKVKVPDPLLTRPTRSSARPDARVGRLGKRPCGWRELDLQRRAAAPSP